MELSAPPGVVQTMLRSSRPRLSDFGDRRGTLGTLEGLRRQGCEALVRAIRIWGGSVRRGRQGTVRAPGGGHTRVAELSAALSYIGDRDGHVACRSKMALLGGCVEVCGTLGRAVLNCWRAPRTRTRVIFDLFDVFFFSFKCLTNGRNCYYFSTVEVGFIIFLPQR